MLKLKLILITLICSCGTNSSIDASKKYSKQESNIIENDIKICLNSFNKECLPICLKMENHSLERKNCISYCEYSYRICTECINY